MSDYFEICGAMVQRNEQDMMEFLASMHLSDGVGVSSSSGACIWP